MIIEENGRSKEFGFVQFELEEFAHAAIKSLHGTMLEGRKLYVSKFMKKNERKPVAEEPKFTNVYVKNMDKDLTKDLLQEKFSKFGKTCNVVIMKNKDGKSRGFEFANFESSEDSQKAVQAVQGALLGSKHLYVKHFNSDVDDKTLQELFSPFGHLTPAKVIWYAYGVSKGNDFVCFSSPEKAKKALEALHDTHFHEATLYVTYA
ncbi:RNA recognition motif domain [Dillenia turbinata]|uniref:RNA recognition motif domain n=1 Tax=Dillenia turbinata TaxID=194707 RepID=A0AAN8VEJ4_9MAGN